MASAPTSEVHSVESGIVSPGELKQGWDVGPRYTVNHGAGLLGRGSYGVVVAATDTLTGQTVAIKRIKALGDIVDVRRLLREIHLLRHLKHPNMVALLDVIYRGASVGGGAGGASGGAAAAASSVGGAGAVPTVDASSSSSSSSAAGTTTAAGSSTTTGGGGGGNHDVYLVFEYADTDFYKLVTSPQYLSELHVASFIYQLLCCVEYMHRATPGGVIHRDLKPANVLCNEDCTIRVCDFGLARVVPDGAGAEEHWHNVCTPCSALTSGARSSATAASDGSAGGASTLTTSSSFTASSSSSLAAASVLSQSAAGAAASGSGASAAGATTTAPPPPPLTASSSSSRSSSLSPPPSCTDTPSLPDSPSARSTASGSSGASSVKQLATRTPLPDDDAAACGSGSVSERTLPAAAPAPPWPKQPSAGAGVSSRTTGGTGTGSGAGAHGFSVDTSVDSGSAGVGSGAAVSGRKRKRPSGLGALVTSGPGVDAVELASELASGAAATHGAARARARVDDADRAGLGGIGSAAVADHDACTTAGGGGGGGTASSSPSFGGDHDAAADAAQPAAKRRRVDDGVASGSAGASTGRTNVVLPDGSLVEVPIDDHTATGGGAGSRYAASAAAAGGGEAAGSGRSGHSSGHAPQAGAASAAAATGGGGGGHQPPLTVTRTMTRHVQTRFYRAPELILLQDYGIAVDVWSLGCIFAELLSMQIESVPHFNERRPLFPGRTCYPLSADSAVTVHDRRDQLNTIFSIIGTPTPEDVAECESADVRAYLAQLPVRKRVNLATKYPGAPPSAIDLLTRMLTFNPRKRITVAEALEHPFLAPVRALDPLHRRERVPSPAGINAMLMECEANGLEELKALLVEEVRLFKASRAGGSGSRQQQTAAPAAGGAAAVEGAPPAATGTGR